MSFHWLRDGKGKTGFSVRFTLRGDYGEVGVRWTRRVFNAPAGPWLYWAPGNLQLDGETLRYVVKQVVGR